MYYKDTIVNIRIVENVFCYLFKNLNFCNTLVAQKQLPYQLCFWKGITEVHNIWHVLIQWQNFNLEHEIQIEIQNGKYTEYEGCKGFNIKK